MNYKELIQNRTFQETFETFCNIYNLEVSQETFEHTFKDSFDNMDEAVLYLIKQQYNIDIREEMSDVWYCLDSQLFMDNIMEELKYFYQDGYLFKA